MNLKIKPLDLALRIASVALAAAAVLLIFFALVSVAGGGSPNLFGKSVYIAKTDAFGVIREGNAVLSDKVRPEALAAGNIIIYKTSDDVFGIAEIETANTRDGILEFTSVSERGKTIVIPETRVVGKAVQYSGPLGWFVTFVKSPIGLLIIAVLLPLAILLRDLVLPAVMNHGRTVTVTPVNKQEDSPTFIPRTKPIAKPPAAVYPKQAKPELAENPPRQESPLFESPAVRRAPLQARPTQPRRAEERANGRVSSVLPVSQKRLYEVMAKTRPQGKLSDELIAALADKPDAPYEVDDVLPIKPIQQPAPSARAAASTASAGLDEEPETRPIPKPQAKPSARPLSRPKAGTFADMVGMDAPETDGERQPSRVNRQNQDEHPPRTPNAPLLNQPRVTSARAASAYGTNSANRQTPRPMVSRSDLLQ